MTSVVLRAMRSRVVSRSQAALRERAISRRAAKERERGNRPAASAVFMPDDYNETPGRNRAFPKNPVSMLYFPGYPPAGSESRTQRENYAATPESAPVRS